MRVSDTEVVDSAFANAKPGLVVLTWGPGTPVADTPFSPILPSIPLPPLPGTTVGMSFVRGRFGAGPMLDDVIQHLWLAAFGGVSNSDHFRSQSRF